MNIIQFKDRDLSANVNSMRADGIIPGVLYGPGIEHQLISILGTELNKTLDRSGEVYELQSKGRTCFVKFDEVQRNPVKNDIIHFSLVQLPKGIESDIEVPVIIKGDCIGVKNGGVLVTMKDSLVVTSSPSKMPDSVEIDISKLEIGENITIANLQKDKDLMIIGDPDDVVVMCQAVSLDQDIDNQEASVDVIDDVRVTP